MWQRGDFLVPFRNGEPYSHKPPLMFWMFHAGWAAAGVNDITPRLVSPLLGLATLWVTGRIAAALWPDAPWLANRAAWILLGSMLFALFSEMVMFDVLLTLCVAVGVLGLALAPKSPAPRFRLARAGHRRRRPRQRAGRAAASAAGSAARAVVAGPRHGAVAALVCGGRAGAGRRGRHRPRLGDSRWPARRRRLPQRDLLGPDREPHGRIVRAPASVVVVPAVAAADPGTLVRLAATLARRPQRRPGL